MKIHQAAMVAHRSCFSMVAGCGTSTLRIHMAIIFSVECKLCHDGAPRSST